MCNSTAGSYNWSKYQMYFDISQNKKKHAQSKDKTRRRYPESLKDHEHFFHSTAASITIYYYWCHLAHVLCGPQLHWKEEDSRVKTPKPQTETQLQHTLWIRIQDTYFDRHEFLARMYRHLVHRPNSSTQRNQQLQDEALEHAWGKARHSRETWQKQKGLVPSHRCKLPPKWKLQQDEVFTLVSRLSPHIFCRLRSEAEHLIWSAICLVSDLPQAVVWRIWSA